MGFFRYGELPLVILVLLGQEAANGYELMGRMEAIFGPRYVPSPGSIYPALSALERERLIQAVDDEVPRRYRPTVAGKAAIEERDHVVARIEHRTGTRLRADGTVDEEFDRLRGLVVAARGRVDPGDLKRVLKRASKRLTELMGEKGG